MRVYCWRACVVHALALKVCKHSRGPLRASLTPQVCVQQLEDRIALPAIFSRPYCCVIKWCKKYIMEELGTLVWIGCLMAKHGPPKFQLLWKQLQVVLKHHLFDADPSAADCERANRSMDAYCETIDSLVLSGHVRSPRALCELAYYNAKTRATSV